MIRLLAKDSSPREDPARECSVRFVVTIMRFRWPRSNPICSADGFALASPRHIFDTLHEFLYGFCFGDEHFDFSIDVQKYSGVVRNDNNGKVRMPSSNFTRENGSILRTVKHHAVYGTEVTDFQTVLPT
jgi:hypothetical protein